MSWCHVDLPFSTDTLLEKYLKKLTGNTEIEDSLERLDKLTRDEARLASAELLKITRSVDGKVMGVDDRVKGVEEKVQDVSGDVQDVCGHVQDVGNKVQGVDDKEGARHRLRYKGYFQ